MNDEVRMFIAAQLPPEMRRALSAFAAALKQNIPAHYSRRENYHITLAFLGETPLSLVSRLDAIIQSACKSMPPIPASLSSPGIFGKQGNAILWCGINGAPPLVGLSGRIRETLDEKNIHYDPKPMKPHITLARKADLSGIDLTDYTPEHATGHIDHISLYSSQRINGILTYTPLTNTVLG